MTTQALLRNIELQIKRDKSPFVVLPLEKWEQIEDILSELSSPRLLKSIKSARLGVTKAKAYKDVRKALLK